MIYTITNYPSVVTTRDLRSHISGTARAHTGEELEQCIKQADMVMHLEKAKMKAIHGRL